MSKNKVSYNTDTLKRYSTVRQAEVTPYLCTVTCLSTTTNGVQTGRGPCTSSWRSARVFTRRQTPQRALRVEVKTISDGLRKGFIKLSIRGASSPIPEGSEVWKEVVLSPSRAIDVWVLRRRGGDQNGTPRNQSDFWRNIKSPVFERHIRITKRKTKLKKPLS